MKSDNAVLAIAVLAAVISIVGAGVVYYSSGPNVTGFSVSDTATVNITIPSSAAINFTTDNINWGNGSVITGDSNVTLDSSNGDTTGGQGFTSVNQGFVLENIGNVNVTVNLKTGKDAQDFLGGTNPSYQYNVTNLESGSCTQASGFTLGTWNDVSTTGQDVCSNFGFSNDADTIRIDLKLVVPSDSKTGSLSDKMTATATAVS